MIPDDGSLLSAADVFPSLEKTLNKTLKQNQDVKNKLENCAAELTFFNETVKIEIAEDGGRQHVATGRERPSLE